MDTSVVSSKKERMKKSKPQKLEASLYSHSIITRKVDLSCVNVGRNLMQTFDAYIKTHYEGKCSVEGYIKPGSINIISYSAGKTYGDMISFNVVFDCDICSPVEGMHIMCQAVNITKAGIRAESNESPSPVVVFIARDHYYDNDTFNSINEGDSILIRVLGSRFELNDTKISVIAELMGKK
uniref:S1 motif domain-containing protein n=1 Tax=viral metagenome TaxID=1070528 RepID=A0A6C0FDM2_9ZZZZ